jgi:SnoaL-like domain
MKTMYALLLVAGVAIGCEMKKTVSTPRASTEEKTKEVLEHHWKTFQANDLEGTMADYTEESFLITPDRTYKGLDEIRENFVNAFAAFPKDSTTMQLDKSIVQQDVGYIIWQATTPTFRLTYGTDTFIIQNGKIIRQTYAGVASPL